MADATTTDDAGPLIIEPASLPPTPLADITGSFPLSQMLPRAVSVRSRVPVWG